MAIIKQYDKRSGITYVYEATYTWNKEKQQSRCKRKLIGRLDVATGEVIPTDGRCKKDRAVKESKKSKKRGPNPSVVSKRLFFGATYLLEAFSEQIGLTKDLQSCFPEQYKELLSIAFYLLLEDNSPLYRFEKWHQTHKHPCGEEITSPRSSELFSAITDDQIHQFFRCQAKRRAEKEYWAYDSTSISSYSETLKQVQYGKNKEDDKLPQLNLLLVFGEKSRLPFYYRKLAGNIPDVKTVKTLLHELNVFGIGKTKLVMDRGFYSEKNINALYKEHLKFLLGASLSLKFIRSNLEEVYDDIRFFKNFDATINTYGKTVATEWEYKQYRPYKGDVDKDTRRIYIHYFYSIDKGAEEETAFDKKISNLYEELKTEQRVESHEKEYSKYFNVKKTPKRGIKVECKEDEIKMARRYLGYFALVTNEKMDAFKALHYYKTKDVVEKAFGNLKERLNMRRLLVSSERSLEGKIFVEFLALILVSYLDSKMKDKKLYKKYSMNQLLDKLDIIECFEAPGYETQVGEVLATQNEIFETLGVERLSSS